MADERRDTRHDGPATDDGLTGSGAPITERKDYIDLSQPNGEVVDKIEMQGNPSGGSKD